MINPYQTPEANPDNESAPKEKITSHFSLKDYLKEYFSLSGSFTRLEFLSAGLIISVSYIALAVVVYSFTTINFPLVGLTAYILWGFAVGKRAKTVGFNMSSGFMMGLLMPFMALIFIIQEGTKDKEVKQRKLDAKSVN